MEIERKFLINNIDNLDLTKYKKKSIIQDYLYFDRLSCIRKRKIESNNEIKYTYTIKTDKTGISVNEIEKEIDEKTYNSLEKNDKYITINKDRYIIPYKNHKIELDIFKEKYEGIIFAEIEFESVEIANNFELPKWFGKEISENITNAEMATKDLNSFIKGIKKNTIYKINSIKFIWKKHRTEVIKTKALCLIFYKINKFRSYDL